MTNSIVKIASLLLLAYGLALVPAFAAGLPKGYPDIGEFQNIGPVDSVSLVRQTIIINDHEYMLTPNIVVHKSAKKTGSLRDVRVGKKVGLFASAGDTESMPVISEIWVLPRNFSINTAEISYEKE